MFGKMHVEDRIEKYLCEGISVTAEKKMRDHMSACERCSRHYERAILLERALCGKLSAPSVLEIERGAEKFCRSRPETGAKLQGGILRLAISAVAACILAVAGWLFIAGPGWKQDRIALPAVAAGQGIFAEKGAAVETGARIRVFRIFRAEGGFKAEEVFSAERKGWEGSGRAAIKPGDVLAFTYTNLTELDRLFVFGIDEGYGLKWYYPVPEEGRSISVGSGKTDEILPYGVDVKVNHEKGRLRIYALFTDGDISIGDVKRWVPELRGKGAVIESEERFPFAGKIFEQTLLLKVGGRE